jgi:LAS superfamily LD-carboxypeptidase LdcB
MQIKKKIIITEKEKQRIKFLLQKIIEEKKEKFSITDFDTVYGFLNKREVNSLKKLLKINPFEYGFKGEYLGIQEVPKDLVEIEGQRFKADNEEGFQEIGIRYLPQSAYKAYKRINDRMFKEIGRRVLVTSGYRSPAYQLFLFAYYLDMYDFDIQKTIERVAVPGYSEHSVADYVAIDFITEEGVPQDKDERLFEGTEEYKWLLENAKKYGFGESYPLNNKLGVMYEPWHWRYVGD